MALTGRWSEAHHSPLALRLATSCFKPFMTLLDSARVHDRLLKGVWAVIPAHNRCEITCRCLAHLAALEVHRWLRVLVVDDGSTDGTAEQVREAYPWVELVVGDGQLWWGGAIRLGMEHAARHHARCILWLNDDTLPAAGSLETLAHMALEREVVCGGVCPTGGPGGFAYGGGEFRGGWPVRFDPTPDPSAPPMEAEWLHGNLVAIPSCMWQRAGFPESRWIKHHFADVEYTWRAKRHGIPLLLVPSARGDAAWNDGGSYHSWRDPQLTAMAIWRGFWSPKMWWYAPGVGAFQLRVFGVRGVLRFLTLFPKALIASLYKQLLKNGPHCIKGYPE